MDVPGAYMSENNVHLFGFSLGEGWVVMDGHKVHVAEPKVHVFDFYFSLRLGWVGLGWVGIAVVKVYMAEHHFHMFDLILA
jgi:hypothetical protein